VSGVSPAIDQLTTIANELAPLERRRAELLNQKRILAELKMTLLALLRPVEMGRRIERQHIEILMF
jgi:hypothetical protein